MSVGDIVHYMKKVLLKTFLHAFWVFPVEHDKITLLNELSFTYGDSLKYLDIYIHEYEKKYKVVFPLKAGTCPAENGDIIVRPLSLRYFKELLTSGTIITNAGGISYLPKRKKQKIINTWHGGGPYKKTSTDVYDSYWYMKEVEMNCKNTDLMLSSCKYFSEIEARSMGFKSEQCIPVGLPRNDILFGEHRDIVNKVRDFYSIPDGVKLILYAPTFRSDTKNLTGKFAFSDMGLDVDMLLFALKEKYDCEWVCAVRLHPKLKNIDMSGMNVINCTEYPDMQELLCCADAIVTDYSSLMWDYSFTYRPVFLYAPDIEQYERERGFYMPVSEWPYPLAHDNEEMRRNILEFDYDNYLRQLKEHHIAAGSYETGKACQKVMELMKS